MGAGPSTPIPIPVKKSFGSINPTEDGKVRPGYYFRNNTIIYKGAILPILDGESDFKKLKYGYLKSNKRVFYKGIPLPFANPSTFLIITRNNTINLSDNPEKNAEFAKLNSVLGMDFIANKKRIYFKTQLIHQE